MSYVLYFNPDSANIVVRMILEELEADYTDCQVPRKRSDRDAAFLRLNPRGLLPVLVDNKNDTVLSETGAIALYLADLHGNLAPKQQDVASRAEYLKWLFMLSNTLHADLNIRFYPERYVNEKSEIAPLLEATRKRIHGHFELLDAMLGEHTGEWFLSSGLSVCDFYVGCCVRWAQMYPVGHAAIDAGEVKRFGNLTRLLSALQQRGSVRRALSREGISGNAFIDPVVHLPARKADAIGTVMP